MRHAALVGSLLLAASCRPERSPTPLDAVLPAPEVPSEVAEIPVEAVVQYELVGIPEGFDPSGRVAVDRRCSAWRDGVYLGRLSEDRCEAWKRPDVRESLDGRYRATIDGAAVVIARDGGSEWLECEGCEPVVGIAWDEAGERIALVREGGDAVELWSVGERRRLRSIALKPTGRITGAQMAWPGRLHVLLTLADERPSCVDVEDPEAGSCVEYEVHEAHGLHDERPRGYVLVTYADLEAPPVHRALEVTNSPSPGDLLRAGLEYDAVVEARLDPGGRCLYTVEADGALRDSLGSTIVATDVEGECPISTQSGDDDDDDALESGTTTRELLSWVEAPRSQFIAIVHESDGEDSLGTVEFEVNEIGEVHRRWAREFPVERHEDMPWAEGRAVDDEFLERQPAELITFGMLEDDLEVEWRQCFHGAVHLVKPDESGERWIKRDWCERNGRSLKGCETLDLAPSRGYGLSMCGKGALTLVGPAGERIDMGTVVSRADEESLAWSWGRDWLVTVDRSNGVVWRSLEHPASGRTLGPSEAWVPTILGPDLDRIVLRDDEGLQVLDGTSGEVRTRVVTTLGPIIGAALSPSGERLAVTDGAMVEARPLSGEAPLATWEASGSPYLAWRQDERVVFSGPDILGPTQAWDLEADAAVPEALPDRGSAFPLDPSWRWQLLTTRRVRRVLDGLALSFEESGVMLDDGRFEGSPEALGSLMYRVGEDRAYSPMLDPEVMRSVMEVEGLRATFFAGLPIDSGPITVTGSQRDALIGR